MRDSAHTGRPGSSRTGAPVAPTVNDDDGLRSIPVAGWRCRPHGKRGRRADTALACSTCGVMTATSEVRSARSVPRRQPRPVWSRQLTRAAAAASMESPGPECGHQLTRAGQHCPALLDVTCGGRAEENGIRVERRAESGRLSRGRGAAWQPQTSHRIRVGGRERRARAMVRGQVLPASAVAATTERSGWDCRDQHHLPASRGRDRPNPGKLNCQGFVRDTDVGVCLRRVDPQPASGGGHHYGAPRSGRPFPEVAAPGTSPTGLFDCASPATRARPIAMRLRCRAPAHGSGGDGDAESGRADGAGGQVSTSLVLPPPAGGDHDRWVADQAANSAAATVGSESHAGAGVGGAARLAGLSGAR
jgi:hypothetical protein